jgi:putative transposase
MAHTFTNLLTHVVFSTHERTPFLNDAIRSDMHAYLGGILRELRATGIAIGGTADHVHILTRLPSDLALADCVRVLKANSSRWVKERWPERPDVCMAGWIWCVQRERIQPRGGHQVYRESEGTP